VPAGSHRVEVRLGPTPARLAGAALAAAALALAALWGASRGLALRGVRGRRGRWAPGAAGLAAALAAAGCAVAGAALGARPPRAVPPGAARAVLDLAGAVARAGAETRAPPGAGRGPLPPFLEVGYARLAGEQRRWLYMHPPAEAAARLRVPAGAYLQAGLGLDPRAWAAGAGDGARFLVEAEGPAGRATLLDRRVNPRARGEDRGWVDVWVSLAALAGQEVRLVLRTEPGEDPSYDWAGWANPQVVVWAAARPHPGAPHPW
jgi:hypothetical protein